MSKAREIVLRLVSEGKISVEEAEELLDEVEGKAKESSTGISGADSVSRAERAYYRAKEARERAKARTKGGGGFEFNFPWDQPDWAWPWEREGWQWPWEQEGWQWGQQSEEEQAVCAVDVPESAQLRIKVDGGDLSIRGNAEVSSLKLVVPGAVSKITAEEGVINISSDGEDVVIEVPERVASIEVSQNGGDMILRKVEADLTAKVAGGDMVISGLAGAIQASVEGGDSRITDTRSTSVEVRTQGGDTLLSMIDPVQNGSIILSGTDNISLILPKDSQCQISASTQGNIAHSLPREELEIAEENENFLNAELNGGGADITLSSSSGDISIGVA